MEAWQVLAVLVAVTASFLVSASAGLGGSLILVPALVLGLGPKAGVALAALLLGANNVVKVAAYRRTLPLRAVLPLVALTAAGALLGARLLVAVDERLVTVAVFGGLLCAFAAERLQSGTLLRAGAPTLAFASGVTSGFSGTSGPLKGVAIRSLGLERMHTVGGASVVSLAGDLTKASVFAAAGLLGGDAAGLAVAAVPLMVAATFTGRRLTEALGERGYAVLFWAVMAGYSIRLAFV